MAIKYLNTAAGHGVMYECDTEAEANGLKGNMYPGQLIRVGGTLKALSTNRTLEAVGGGASVEAFNPSIKADKVRYFPEFTQSGVINLVKDPSVIDYALGEDIPNNGYHGIFTSNGNAINHTNDFDFITKDTLVNGEKFALTSIWRGQRFSASLQQVQEPSDTSGPTMTTLVVAADNLTAVLSFSEASYANNDGTGDLQLTDFGTATLTGGTATAPVLSNPVHTAGGSSITFDLSFTGTANGSEVLEIPVADGASIYDVNGNAMDSGQSAVDNLSVTTIFQDSFTDTNGTALTAHTPEVGSAPFIYSGAQQIQSNRLVRNVTDGIPLWDGTQADINMSFVLNVSGDGGTVSWYARWLSTGDADNRLVFTWNDTANTLAVGDVISGSYTELQSVTLDRTETDHNVEVILNGGSIICNIDSVEELNTTTTLTSGNYVGVLVASDIAIDNLIITSV
jgi:hypothetical protein